MKRSTLITLVVLLFTSFSANAGFYIGGVVGSTEADGDFSADSATGLRVTAGYGFAKFFAFELGYISLGEHDLQLGESAIDLIDALGSAQGALDLEPDNNIASSAEGSGFEFAGKVSIPLNPMFDIYARLGVYQYDLDYAAGIDDDIGGEIFDTYNEYSTSDAGVVYSIGFAFDFIPKLSASIEYSAYSSELDYSDITGSASDIGSADVDTTMVGFGINFEF